MRDWKKFLAPVLLALTLVFTSTAHADWGTSSAQPVAVPNACFYPSDYASDMRGFTDYICTWSPDHAESYFNDTLGRRADLCVGNPAQGDVDLTTTDGKYCARVHGLTSTDSIPFGFKMGWQYVRWVGFYGIDMDNWWVDEQIGSYRVGPHTHVLFCGGDLTGPYNDVCNGYAQNYFLNTGETPQSGTPLPFLVKSLTIGANAPLPPLCPYLTGQSQPAPTQWKTCTSTSASGLSVGLAGDGVLHSGGFAVLGNLITAPLHQPCAGIDANGKLVVFVYPVVQGTQTTNPDGSQAFVATCP